MAAYAALLSLAQTTDLIVNHDSQCRFYYNAESKIRSIHEYVNFLLSFLENFPESATRWEDRVREVARKTEDIIQHYIWQQMKSMMPSTETFEGLLKDLIVDIGLIVGQMMEERPAYVPAAAAVSVSSPATTGKDAVIGLQDDVTAIKDRLCGQSSKLRVVPIVGMGGIGKTTLARTVYDDSLILYHFHIRAWVTVSQDYSPHKLSKILLGLVDSVKLFEKELSGEMTNQSEEEEVEEQVLGEMIEESELELKVYQSLKGRRYLIVMDDVWRTDVWDDLKNVFPDDNNGSRIMLTTRLSDLATYPDFGSPLHEMQFMDDHESWELLKQKVFTNSSNIPPEWEDVGKEIARKCAGLPLAVVLVAGVLSTANTTQAFWEEIARSANLVVKEELEEILSFSYTHLPHHLRPCFLYIGGFPEDEEIHASRLIKLWVAEGFLKHQFRCSKSLEDEAEVYLDDLVKRNLLLVNSRKTNGKIKSCSLHDIVRDVCVRKACEEKFLGVLDGCVLLQGLMNERRISFNHSDINGIFGPTIRSVLCFQLQSFSGWEAFLGSSTLLKVLNGVGSNGEDQPPIPSQVFDLFHLTHLVLIGSFNIPSAISNLVNLQTLIIHPTFRQRKRKLRDNYKNASQFPLPLEIWGMRKLRHLILYDLYTLPPPPDESNLPLEKLQTLSPLENVVCSERMVQMIPNVKKMALVYSSNEEYHLHHLDCLHQLEKLQITGYKDFSWRGKNLAFSTTLQKLSFVGVKFPGEDMGIIGSLPNLQVLKLLNHACHGETWETDDGEFPQLTFLLIDRSLLQQWTHGSSSFPKLRCLVLRSCVYLQEIAESIGEIPTLELIEVYDCGWSLMESVEKIREDQRSYGNDALQVRVICSDEVRPLPSYSVAAYAALLSLAQTTDLSANQDNQYRFSCDAESKIRSIHDEYVNFLLLFLENFPEKATRWEDRVREVAHKIEDIIQHYMWQQMKSMRPSSKLFEDRLEDLIEEIGLIVGQMMEERPARLPPAVVSVSSPATARKDAVIGLQADVMAIKNRLCGQSSKLRVVPIVGMGGIGKTTLARTLYDDPLMLYHFDIRAWVTISQDYSPDKLRKILIELLDSVKLFEKELSREKIHESGELEVKEQVSGDMIEESQLKLKVYQSLKGRRYLIVIDDVWRTDVWDDLRDLFPDDNNGSRIMLTTRLSDVATYPDFSSPLHEMRFMDDHQSWDLLKQKVFTNSGNFPPELEDVGKEIARKCAGLPLAVVLVAGVLSAANTTRASWEEIARSENLVVKEELKEILSFSYTQLPHHLRPCFLYIGGFPEDEEIHATRLIKLWMAEGFLKHQFGCSKSLDDEAEVYLDDLVKRNLVQVNSKKTNGKINSCGLHDTVRDMCVRKAREEKFLRVLDGCVLPQGVMDERHISFNHSVIDGILGPTIRSILCFQLQSFDGWEAFLGNSTLLKVLYGVGSSGEDQPPLPPQVFDLFHLTHLVLIGSFNIPSAISNLVNLQTLIIHPTFRERKRNWRENYKNASHFLLPLEIWRMRHLRHLILYDLYVLPLPPDESNLPLEKLQTLSPLENLVWSERMVQMIPNVKKLGLVYSCNEEYHLHHLDCLHQLEKLQITGYNDFSWRGQNHAFPTTLQKLSLVGVKFPWEDMSIIGSLPNLQVLKLLNHACVGETWETGDEEFPQLKFLLIDRSLLQQWTHGSSSFPILRSLVLRSCVYLQEIPESIGEIPTLELIEVYDCGRSLVESVEKIREDQRSYGNDTLQVRVVCSDEVRPLPSYSVAAYAALLSLAQTTDLSANQHNQYPFSFDAESDIRSIHDEYVNFLLSFLENYPEKATRWEDRVREVAHEIEDIIQHYMWQQMKSMKPSSMIFEGQLKKLTEEIGLIVGKMMEERPAHLPAAVVSVSSPATARKDAVIGLQADVTAIKDRLCGQSSKLQVVPIVGLGGIGKTTLARTVYDDPLILYHFDIRAWLTVSQDYGPHKLRKFLLGLLDSVNLFEKGLSRGTIIESRKEEQVLGEMIEESELELKVYQSLEGRRYLVVMDDVWRRDVWNDLRNVFPDDNNGSRIMLTTRLSDLATNPDFDSPLHEMQFMDVNQSWDLLKQKVFTNSSNIPPELEDVGKEIARKCAGLPLAVVLVAGVLSAANTTQASWEEMARNENLVVKEELKEILSFSYTHLPHHLRPCFLFIGVFPEDEEIYASRLITLWVAEGFLKNQFGCWKSLEDEAEVYLDDLVKRNLVLVTSRKTDGKIKSCGLHDTVRNMCIRKAHEEKFFRVLDGCDIPQGVMNERRISFNHSNINGIFGPTIRSILCFQLQSFPDWEAFLGSSTLLKVLNGVGSSGEDQPPLPPQVFDLFHLTHLVLIGSFNIPSAISNLVNLQTLIIHPNFRQRKRNWRVNYRRKINWRENYKTASHFLLPEEIWRMRQLRHLILNDLYELPPPPDGSNLPLEKLQTLSTLENLVWSERMVQMIPNVKKLGLVYTSCEVYYFHHLDYLRQLEKLTLQGRIYLRRVNYIAFFPMTLQKLSLVGVYFPWKHMGIIGSLPNLQVLKLLNDAGDVTTWETGHREFPQLKFLLIDTSYLRKWTTRGISSFPILNRLVLRSCSYLQEIPESIGEIPTLEHIEVYYCRRSLVDSVERIRKHQESKGNDALQVRVVHRDDEAKRISLFHIA